MVRVTSQNFSPPRSRHSSGETDRDLAERANLALTVAGRKLFEVPEYESSSDSFWDSELDGDQYDTLMSENGDNSNDINGNAAPEKSDAQSKRKERRRERNKLSAQAYRQRRKSQNVKEQQTLMQLEAENKRLHKLVETLEKKTEHAKHLLRGCPLPISEILQPIGELDGASADIPESDPDLANPRRGLPFSSQLISKCQSSVNMTLNPNPNLTLPSPNFVQKLGHSSILNDSHQLPQVTNDKALNLTYPSSSKQNPPVCSALSHNQIIFNTNVLIGATLCPTGTTNLTAVPAILAVPLENQNNCYSNSNLSCNPLCSSHPGTNPAGKTPIVHESESSLATLSDDKSSIIGAVWWNGNKIEPCGNTVQEIVKMKISDASNLYNSNASADDANGNNNCDRNQKFPSMSFNLNQNTGVESHGTISQDNFQLKHPVVSVQYFLAPSDQVSVQ